MTDPTLADVQAAERLLDEARNELDEYRNNSDDWAGCFETVDGTGRRGLQMSELHFAKIDALQSKVERAAKHLQWTKQKFWGA